MRAIIRFSVDNDTNSALRNKLWKALEKRGFTQNNNTATYENQHIGKAELEKTLSNFWSISSKHKNSGRIDHFWMYADRTGLDDIHPTQ